jgi:hypothetical protein
MRPKSYPWPSCMTWHSRDIVGYSQELLCSGDLHRCNNPHRYSPLLTNYLGSVRTVSQFSVHMLMYGRLAIFAREASSNNSCELHRQTRLHEQNRKSNANLKKHGKEQGRSTTIALLKLPHGTGEQHRFQHQPRRALTGRLHTLLARPSWSGLQY